MTIDPASFKIRFPEFDSVDDTRIQLFLDDAEVILNPVFWGDKYDMGQAYLAAHFLVIGTNSEAGSTSPSSGVASKSVDGVSISYNNPTPNSEADAYYLSTSYGQRYLALRKTLGVPAFVI